MIGLSDRLRTCDLTLPKRALYHLSYTQNSRSRLENGFHNGSKYTQNWFRGFLHLEPPHCGIDYTDKVCLVAGSGLAPEVFRLWA